MKKTLFLVFSGAILIFSIISICSSPIINGDIIGASSWKALNCKLEEDKYNLIKSDDNKKSKNLCQRKKAMYGLEYSSLTIDVIFGFICAVLGLFHYFEIAKPFEKISGLIGLGSGIVIFILTLTYICYSGYIFTNDSTNGFDSNNSFKPIKLDSEGAFAKWDDSKNSYKFLYYKDNEPTKIKYNDLGKKQYNYEKKRHYDNDRYTNCDFDITSISTSQEYFQISGYNKDNCPSLYMNEYANGFENKYVFDRWVTTIIFSCFIVVCCIGLAIFGFLLFNSDNSGL